MRAHLATSQKTLARTSAGHGWRPIHRMTSGLRTRLTYSSASLMALAVSAGSAAEACLRTTGAWRLWRRWSSDSLIRR
ncbi:Uncharacterised protein [Bordetella pertussis]|nr:Uncharacterised protein [Bordetella pertussis]